MCAPQQLPQVIKRNLAFTSRAMALDRAQNFPVPPAKVAAIGVPTPIAVLVVAEGPVEQPALALLAKVIRKRRRLQEPHQRIHLALSRQNRQERVC